ncbi:MAG TPA: alpha/beta hydrolase [Steroidobacteraceae bacterium]|nr:alpha/beta hydrolase [Steroidobacteraceae bacterium]
MAAAAIRAAPRSDMVTVAPGVQIHVLEEGKATRLPVLVLVPGWRLTAAIWSDQLHALSQNRRVIAIDPRSQGDSTKTDEGDTPEQRARDYHALLASRGIRSCVLLGWSQGVQDVAAYVDQFGTAGISGIVLVDSTISQGASGIVSAPQFAQQQLKLLAVLADSPREYTQGMMRAIISKPMSEAELDQLVAAALKTPTATAEAMLISDLFTTDRTPAIAKFNVPTLVIASGRSAELENQRRLAAQLPQGHIEIVDQAAHAVFIDQPRRFETLVRDFLDQLPKA